MRVDRGFVRARKVEGLINRLDWCRAAIPVYRCGAQGPTPTRLHMPHVGRVVTHQRGAVCAGCCFACARVPNVRRRFGWGLVFCHRSDLASC